MMDSALQFFLPGPPPAVTDQTRALGVNRRTGKPYVYQTYRLRQARAVIRDGLAPFAPEKPLRGPVRLVVKWCFPVPRTGGHRSGEYKYTRPDTDNLQKALKDEMTGLHFWRDDAQVASEVVEKFWSNVPGIFIRVEELTAIDRGA